MADDLNPSASGGGGEGSDPLVGSILAGRYRILRHLGEGAMGAVYLGEHLKIGRKDAIKVLRPSLVRDEEAIARFARGARNASRIHHPNVCTVYDFAESGDDFWFLAMEFIDGEELGDLLDREAPLPLPRAVDLTIQIARALTAAHRLGIVHRDLKPGNVMVGRGTNDRDVAKVVDFDIAKGSSEGQAANVTRMGFTIGTPEYMSPEQLMVDDLDGRSDLYSLGLVLFKMLTGRLPFRGATANELMLERLNQPPLTLAEVSEQEFPEGLQGLLDRTLQRRPDDRPADAVAFMTELEEAVAGTGPVVGRSARRDEAAGGRTSAPGGGELPATRVERRVDPGQVGAQTDGGTRPRPAWVVPVGAAAALAVVAAGGWALFSGGGEAGGTADAGGTPTMVEPATDPSDPADGTADERAVADEDTTDPAQGTVTVANEVPPDDDAPAEGGGSEASPPRDAPVEPRLTGAEVAARLDRLTADFLDDRISAQELRAGARRLWEVEPLPDSIRARVAYGAFVGATAVGDQEDACVWIDRAARFAPVNDRYQTLARGCGG